MKHFKGVGRELWTLQIEGMEVSLLTVTEVGAASVTFSFSLFASILVPKDTFGPSLPPAKEGVNQHGNQSHSS